MLFTENWFSNFKYIGFPIYDEYGIEFYTVENCYQACKTLDINQRQLFKDTKPSYAKRLGRKVHLRNNWEDIKVDIMERALRQKFAKSPMNSWWAKLCDTKNEQIVEFNNWHDNFWGKCTCESCNLNGKNMLGKILMKIRDEDI